ncbi:MAG: hypothetical protein ACRD8O_16655, partial [Bryobacteraceae bacterium]
LWGTGLGPVSGNEGAAPLPGDQSVDIEVFAGGRRATVSYKGRSGCCAGIDQIAFIVPDGVEGCYVPLVVRAGGVVSNFVSMAVAASGSTCSDPFSYSQEDLQKLQTSGSFRSGGVTLSRSISKFTFQTTTIESRTDSGSGSFIRWDPATLLANVGQTPTLGSCTLNTYRGTPNIPTFTLLDAGQVLNLSGPKGNKQLTRQFGVYSATLGGGTPIPGGPAVQPDYLDPGEYTVDNGSGGADVGGFRARVTVPVALVWTNQDSITTVARAQDLRITWTGGDGRDFVIMTGSSSTGTDPRNLTSSSFTCIERVSAGGFTIPSYVVGSLPASEQGFLSVGTFSSAENNRFTAPGLDQGSFNYNFNSSKSVRYQ